MIRRTLKNDKGGAFGIIIAGMAVILAVMLAFVNAADFAIYSYKRNVISKSIDYAVSAAVQEIDTDRSKEGLAAGFDEKGTVVVDNVFLNEERADNAFFSTLKSNTGIVKEKIDGQILIALVNPLTTGLSYTVKTKSSVASGEISNPAELEDVLNSSITGFWDSSIPETDRHVIYVNGNVQTNEFKKRPYYMVFIKDYQIEGLFKRRAETFVGFKGAKVERKKD